MQEHSRTCYFSPAQIRIIGEKFALPSLNTWSVDFLSGTERETLLQSCIVCYRAGAPIDDPDTDTAKAHKGNHDKRDSNPPMLEDALADVVRTTVPVTSVANLVEELAFQASVRTVEAHLRTIRNHGTTADFLSLQLVCDWSIRVHLTTLLGPHAQEGTVKTVANVLCIVRAFRWANFILVASRMHLCRDAARMRTDGALLFREEAVIPEETIVGTEGMLPQLDGTVCHSPSHTAQC
jgi:hypothetical protein